MNPETNPYDEVLYPNHSFAQTHPDRLATIATLFGMKPASVERCRVLELGCGDGANLIPMAFGLRESAFVGVDLAERPIAKGQEMARALTLNNITLRQANLMEITPEFGQFDFIIAHGVYAWVPTEVQEKILNICRTNLAPNGVAYVSYNTYPGCHLRDMVREMMLFHVRDICQPQERVRQSFALLKFLGESQIKPDLYRLFLQAEVEHVTESSEAYLYHDDLAEINQPVYFHQFAEHAARHALQYLGEANYYEMQDHIYTPEVVRTLRQLSDNRTLREQYLDFLKCRRFRQTLLCRAEVTVDTTLKPELISRFYVSSSARPDSATPEIQSRRSERFVGKHEAKMETDYPLGKAAMVVRGEAWPQRLTFADLLVQARARLGNDFNAKAESAEQQEQNLRAILLQTYACGLVQFHVHAPHFSAQPSERPQASALARWQVQHGNVLTNLFHDVVKVDGELAGHLLCLLDGSRDRVELLRAVSSKVQSMSEAGPKNQPSAAALVPDRLREHLEKNLAKLARLGLLVA